MSKLHQISANATCGCDSVLLWRPCDTLCTSGLVDDAMFAHNPPDKSEQVGCLLKVTHQQQQLTGC